MKAEKRHELQTNDLAIWLARTLEKLGPYKNLVLGGCVLLVVGIALASYLYGMNKRKHADAWNSYFEIAMTSDRDNAGENIEAIANTFSGTQAGLWAMNDAGVKYLQAAGDEMFTDRAAAERKLKNAVDAFKNVLSQASDPLLRQRALMGQAQSHESLGEFDDAISSYEEVVTKYADSTFASIAAEKVATLRKPSTRAWYEWFAKQEVAKPFVDPSLFNNIQDLPSDPNINIPEPGALIVPDNSATNGDALNAPISSEQDIDGIFDGVDVSETETDSDQVIVPLDLEQPLNLDQPLDLDQEGVGDESRPE